MPDRLSPALRVVIATAQRPENIELLRTREPRLDVVFEPELLGPPSDDWMVRHERTPDDQARFSAEQAATTGPAASTAPTASNQGARSASSSGMPAAIFATLAAGCSSSPSTNGSPRTSASAAPTVVLPEPETPMTTRGRENGIEPTVAWRHG